MRGGCFLGAALLWAACGNGVLTYGDSDRSGGDRSGDDSSDDDRSSSDEPLGFDAAVTLDAGEDDIDAAVKLDASTPAHDASSVADASITDGSITDGSITDASITDASVIDADSGPPATGPCTSFGSPVAIGTVASTSLNEISGLAASRGTAGILFVHNDSGDSARFFAMSTSGAHLGEFDLSGATFHDAEDIDLGPGPAAGVSYVYIGDIGDNNARTGMGTPRSSIAVFRVAEPSVSLSGPPVSGDVSYDRFVFAYPDRAYDAESMFVDPETGDIYIITKVNSGSSPVFRGTAPFVNGMSHSLSQVGAIPFGTPTAPGSVNATGADIAPDGRAILVRTYSSVLLWTTDSDESPAVMLGRTATRLDAAAESQGEAIGYAFDGRGFFTVSEGSSSTIYFAAADSGC